MEEFYNSNNKVIAPTSELTSAVINALSLENKREPKNILLPRGSALMTSSGQLSPDITAIFHAATGTMYQYTPQQSYFDPSLESVENAIYACFELCKLNGNKRMAIPFIGGKIFKNRIFKAQNITEEEEDSKLIACIVNATIANANSSGCDYCFVAYDEAAHTLFSDELGKSHSDFDFDKHLKKGDIVDFKLHNCDGIVNAANMEVEFGGGISDSIAKATQDESNINKEAKVAIDDFWSKYKKSQL